MLTKWVKKILNILVALAVLWSSVDSGHAAELALLPEPGQMVPLSAKFEPALMVGVQVNPQDPFRINFIMSRGAKPLSADLKQEEYRRILKYFLTSLTIPNADMWVNLSPHEADRIIPDNFSTTEMGRDLLAQDYLLKQITSSLIYPEGETGKKFWSKVYQAAFEKYGTTDIPMDTFNKVWIVPDKAVVYERDNTALAVKSHLKVMLESDYLAMGKSPVNSQPAAESQKGTQELSKQVVREIVIPALESEVNEGENFALLRQVYSAMLMATWFKKALKKSILGQVYANKSKVAGIEIDDPQAKERIYQQYLEAYKRGVFNFIKEEQDPLTQEVIPRKYFSGGTKAYDEALITDAAQSEVVDFAEAHRSDLDLAEARLNADFAQSGTVAEKIPLIKLISYVESAPDQEYAGAIDRVKANSPLLSAVMGYRSNADFISDETKDLIEGQFPSKERAVVELISNAIDAYRKTQVVGRVNFAFKAPNELSVSDIGEGMDWEVILSKLLIPQMSGKVAVEGIGRFGIGFYSTLNFLQDKGDQIIVRTGKGGAESSELIFTRENGEYFVQLRTLTEPWQGTQVTIHLAGRNFDKETITHLVQETFGYNLNASIFMTDELGREEKVNQMDNFEQDFVGQNHFGYSRETLKAETGKLIVSVSGVRIFSIETKGLGLPKTVVLDLPPRTELTISRNAVKVNQDLIKGLKAFLAGIASRPEITDQQKLMLLSALNGLMKDLQKRNDSLFSDDNLENAVKTRVEAVANTMQGQGKILLPNIAALNEVQARDQVAFLDPELFAAVMTDSKVMKVYKSRKLVVESNEIRIFLLNFSVLGEEFAGRKFIFEKDSKMIFLNQEHFTSPDEPLQVEEIKTLLDEPVKMLLGVKGSIFTESAADKLRLVQRDRTASSLTRQQARDRLVKVLLMRQLTTVVMVAGIDEKTASLVVPEGLNRPRLLALAKAEVARVLRNYLPGQSPEFVEDVVDFLLTNAVEEMETLGLPVDKVLLRLTQFGFAHAKKLTLDYYVDDWKMAGLYANGQFADMEDDVFDVLDRRMGANDVPRIFASQVKSHLRPSGLLGVYSAEDVKDAVLDAFVWLEYGVQDPGVKKDLLEILHYITRSIDEAGSRDDKFSAMTSLAKMISKMSEVERALKAGGVSDEMVSEMWRAKLAIIKDNLMLANADQKETLKNIAYLFEYALPNYIEDDGISHKDMPKTVKSILELLGYMRNYKASTIDRRRINRSWSSDLNLRPWQVANLDLFNQILKAGDFVLFFNAINYTGQILSAAGVGKYDKKRIQSDLSKEEIAQNLRDLMLYHLAPGNGTKFVQTMRDTNAYFESLERTASGGNADMAMVAPWWTPPSIRDSMIRVFAMKPGGLARIEEAGRVNIGQPTYTHTVNLSQFYQYYRNHEGAEAAVDFDGIPAYLEGLTAQTASDREREIISRRINQAVQHVSPDTYIFLREMLQNSRDAVHDDLTAERRFDVNLYEETRDRKKVLYVSMADHVGMTFDIIKNFLFVPGSSSKRGREDLEGQYGTGFYTILRDAKEVLIKTSTGNGEVMYIRMTPVLKPETGEVLDTKIEIEARKEDFKGTIIQQVRDADFPDMVAAAVQSRLISYGGVMDPDDIQVRISDKVVNAVKKEMMAEVPTAYGPIRIYHLPGEKTLTHRGLYMNGLTEEYGSWLGQGGLAMIRDRLTKAGVVIDLPPQLRLIKDRSDIKDRDKVLREIGSLIQLAACNALMKMFMARKIDLPEIPYDVFYTGGRMPIDPLITEDANRIARGEPLDQTALAKYAADAEKVPLLLISVPFLEGKSILDYVRLFLDGTIKEDELPQEIRSILNQEIKNKKMNEARQKSMQVGTEFGGYSAGYLGERKEVAVKKDIDLPAYDSENAEHRGLESYFALAEITNWIGSRLTDFVFTTRFYSRPDGSLAHAGRGSNSLSWNLYALKEPARSLQELLSEPGNEFPGLYELLKTIIHEAAHVREGGALTHHVQFYEVELDNMARMFVQEGSFRQFLAYVKQKYAGRLIKQKSVEDFSKFLLAQEARAGQEDDNLVPREGKDLTRAKEKDDAMSPGGIDLNEKNLDLEIKRDGNGVPLPLGDQDPALMNIRGLAPVILNVQPVNDLPAFLGVRAAEIVGASSV